MSFGFQMLSVSVSFAAKCFVSTYPLPVIWTEGHYSPCGGVATPRGYRICSCQSGWANKAA